MQMERWTEFRLDTSERPRVRYEYHVTGGGVFPFDMLRHDSCWAVSGEDAAKMEWSFASPQGERHRSIKLRSYRAPTVDRWSSFHWSVGEAAVV
jgi:hypothetical protein